MIRLLAIALVMLPISTAMAEGRIVRSTWGYIDFCHAHPDQCVSAETTEAPILTPGAWDELRAVNAAVNASIVPVPEPDEVWSIHPERGDCDDFAVTKRHDLLELDWPASALLIAVVRDGERHHAVLVVRTDRGDFVLDNKVSDIRPWAETPYRWIKRQSVEKPNRWVALDGYVDERKQRYRERLQALEGRR